MASQEHSEPGSMGQAAINRSIATSHEQMRTIAQVTHNHDDNVHEQKLTTEGILSDGYSLVAYDVRNATFDDPRLSLPYGSLTASPTTTHLMISFFRAAFVPLVSGVDTWAIAAGQGSFADVRSMRTCRQVLLNRTGSCECGDSEIGQAFVKALC